MSPQHLRQPNEPDSYDDYAWLDEPPRRPLLGRWGIGALALALCVLLAVLGYRLFIANNGALTSAGVVAANGQAPAQPEADSRSTPRDASSGPGSTDSPDHAPKQGPAQQAAGGLLRVHVVGAVKKPGLYELDQGAITADAIKQAGGMTRAADQAGINLAAPVNDGEQIRVPRKGEHASNGPVSGGGGSDGSGKTGRLNTGGGSSGPGAGGKTIVRINSASSEELQQLPGVGPALAQRILDFRAQHGPFRGPADLDAVSGIGPAILSKIEPMVSYD